MHSDNGDFYYDAIDIHEGDIYEIITVDHRKFDEFPMENYHWVRCTSDFHKNRRETNRRREGIAPAQLFEQCEFVSDPESQSSEATTVPGTD